MITNDVAKKTIERMKQIRSRMIQTHPFWGQLTMHLNLSVAEVGTAATDMKHLIFDPSFADKLTDEQMEFVFMHEVFHTAMEHPVRKKWRQHELWNLACDIVTNSCIMQEMGVSDYEIAGEKVIHTSFKGQDGFAYSAEEMYDLLLSEKPQLQKIIAEEEELKNLIRKLLKQKGMGAGTFDYHENWEDIELSPREKEHLERIVEECMRECKQAGNYSPKEMELVKERIAYRGKLNWKLILRNFVRMQFLENDYNYRPPDRRFQNEDFLYPGFNPSETATVKDLFFFVDKSGSISKEQIQMVLGEIEQAVKQVKGLEGKLLYFDAKVRDPIDFKSASQLLRKGIPRTNGGTNFYSIFEYLDNHKKQKPSAIIIMTDGYAEFPPESVAHHIPVLWVIVDSDVKPEWGKYLKV